MQILKIFEGDFFYFLPETFLIISLLLLLSFGVIYKYKNISNIIINISIIIFIIEIFLIINSISYNYSIYNSLFVNSYLLLFFKLFVIIIFINILFLSKNYIFFENIKTFEIIILMNFSILGMLFLLSSNDFLAFYLSLELQSLILYILASYKQFNNYSTEAGIKYFILGAVSSGLLLFGFSVMYGLTGLTNFNDLSLFFYFSYYNLDSILYGGSIISILLILSGLFFKLGSFPFYMWVPDIYQGVPTLITTFFAIIPKLIIFGLIIRLNFLILNNFYFNWEFLYIIIGLGSAFIGTLGALYQVKIKRLLAYSAISHVGFMLISLSSFNYIGLNSLILYLFIYSFLNLNIFSIILVIRKFNNYLKIKNINDLKFLLKSNNILSIILTLTLFSIAGIPPLAGFFSKFFVFLSLLESDFYIIIFILLIISMLGVFYYLRLIKLIYFDLNNNNSFLLIPGKSQSYIIVYTFLLNGLFFFFFNFFFIKINEVILYII